MLGSQPNSFYLCIPCLPSLPRPLLGGLLIKTRCWGGGPESQRCHQQPCNIGQVTYSLRDSVSLHREKHPAPCFARRKHPMHAISFPCYLFIFSSHSSVTTQYQPPRSLGVPDALDVGLPGSPQQSCPGILFSFHSSRVSMANMTGLSNRPGRKSENFVSNSEEFVIKPTKLSTLPCF